MQVKIENLVYIVDKIYTDMTFANKIQGFNALLVKLNGLTDINEVIGIVNKLQLNMDRIDGIGETIDEALDNLDQDEIQQLVASCYPRMSTNCSTRSLMTLTERGEPQ